MLSEKDLILFNDKDKVLKILKNKLPAKKYKKVLPPLSLLSKKQEKQMMDDLKALDFYPEKGIAA